LYLFHFYLFKDIILGIVKSTITLNAIAFSQNGGVGVYEPLINQFNEYSKENYLDINIHLNLFSELNATTEVTDYEEMLDALFLKKNTKYDIIFFDNIYTTRFGPHLLNLNGSISDEILNLYKPGIASQSCIYGEDKWVGLVNISIYPIYFIMIF